MDNTFNKTILIGRLADTPILNTSKEIPYTRFKIVNTEFNPDGTEVPQFHSLIAFGKQAKVCVDYLSKGDLCCVEGKLNREVYEKDGEQKYKVEIVAERITFLSSVKKKNMEHVEA